MTNVSHEDKGDKEDKSSLWFKPEFGIYKNLLRWFILGFFSFFALGILAITIPNHFADESCDNFDSIMGLNLESHSLIYGVVLLCCCIAMFPLILILSVCCKSHTHTHTHTEEVDSVDSLPNGYSADDQMNDFIIATLVFAFFIYIIWDIVWMIGGGFILFRSNMECITSGSIMAIYSLTNWCVNILLIMIFGVIGIEYRFCKSEPAFDYVTI